jgi:hypothetical protein
MNKSGRSFITNGVILLVTTVVLGVYFSVSSLWNMGTIVIIIILLLLSSFYFWLYYKFFKN